MKSLDIPLTDAQIAVRIQQTSIRRLFLSNYHPACSRCMARQRAKDPGGVEEEPDVFALDGPYQVQLTDYIDIVPARWRCRNCGYRFRWEPTVEPEINLGASQ